MEMEVCDKFSEHIFLNGRKWGELEFFLDNTAYTKKMWKREER